MSFLSLPLPSMSSTSAAASRLRFSFSCSALCSSKVSRFSALLSPLITPVCSVSSHVGSDFYWISGCPLECPMVCTCTAYPFPTEPIADLHAFCCRRCDHDIRHRHIVLVRGPLPKAHLQLNRPPVSQSVIWE